MTSTSQHDVDVETSGPDTTGPEATRTAPLPREHLLVIVTLLVASFVVILNETVMSVAIPVLQEDLGVPPSTGQWLTTAFMLTMAVVIPLTGFLIQRVATRTLFVAAMSLFTAGTALAFFSTTFAVLLVARVVQASGTAVMLPLLMTTVMTIVPAARRGAMMGNITVVIAVAPALGPTMSGFVLDHLGWRWIFGVVAPIALAALVIGARYVVSVSATGNQRIDVVSVPLSALGLGGLVYGLVGIGEHAQGSSGTPTWLPFVVGAVALAAFVARQIHLQRTDRALLDLRVFTSGQFRIALGAMLIGMSAMFGSFLLLPLFAQQALGLSALQTGLITLPGGIVMGVTGPFVGRLYDRYGPRVLAVPGSVLVSAGLWLLVDVDADTSLAWLVGANLVLMLGLSATFTPLMTTALGSVEPRLYSYASAVVSTLQQVAGAAGAALFITIMTVVSSAGVESGMGEGAAFVDGVRRAFLVGALLSLLLVALVPFLRKPDAAPAAPAVH
ncbi:MDR family MFS transporter [Aeromicrobium sp. 50.2.37]|uniref:MDR family MFS transporter n=1 Tax=Aeromicrobium sp. 50.2.37 TaxID=2969305 RepID=UPI00215020AF|nr:MDR family MFS transporter [Aeromicrobium sp. 50.2.37]MCR4514031.1 multidrug efflux MFS transporter [Aeromicrobium sp. 50.2.37]